MNVCFRCYCCCLAKLECSLSLMKGVREKARAGIVLEDRGKVWPRNTLLQKLGEMPPLCRR